MRKINYRKTMFKRTIFKLSFFIAYFTILFLIAESILRTFFPVNIQVIDTTVPFVYKLSDNKKIGYELRPNTEDVNSEGFRDFEYKIDKHPNVTRIAVIGDSIAYGIGISDKDKTYAKSLERLLNKKNKRKFEVLNFGVPGYGTVQIFERFKDKVAKYEPDIVIYGYWFNDFHKYGCDHNQAFLLNIIDDSLRTKIWEIYSSFVSKHRLLRRITIHFLNSQLFKRSYMSYYNLKKHFFAEENPDRIFLNASLPDISEAKYWHGVFRGCIKKCGQENDMRFLDRELNEQDFYEYWIAFRDLNNYCKKHSMHLVLLITPVLSNFSDYKYFPLHEFMQKFAESMGIEVVDTLDLFRDKYKNSVPEDFEQCHFNDLGHSLVAEKMAEYLDRRSYFRK